MKTNKVMLVLLITTLAISCSREVEPTATVKKFKLPEKALPCLKGDYVIKEVTVGVWKIFLVTDQVLLSSLAQISPDGSELVERIHFLQNALPPGWEQVFLILTAYDKEYRTELLAISALDKVELGSSVQGLCRPAEFFLKTNSRIQKQKKTQSQMRWNDHRPTPLHSIGMGVRRDWRRRNAAA
jgi:hypothetical protein